MIGWQILATIGAGVATNSTIVAAVIAGVCLLASTGLNLYFQGRREREHERWLERRREKIARGKANHDGSREKD